MSWKYLAVILLLGTAAVSSQTQGRWVRLAPIPQANEEWDSAVVNGKLYLFGGNPVAVGGKQGAPPGNVFEYDPAADRWTKKNNMPQPAHHNAVVGYNGKIYAFGGGMQRQPGGPTQFPIDNSWEYDPVADSWRALAPMPIRRLAAAAVESGGKIYVMGGVGPVSRAREPVARRGKSRIACSTSITCTIRQPTRGSLVRRCRRRGTTCSSGAVSGKIYVIGGRVGSMAVATGSTTDLVEEYDVAADRWGQ